MNINSLQQAEKILLDIAAKSPLYWDGKENLAYLDPLLSAVGDPHKKLRAVHVAGSSGKTSTAYYCSRLLRSTGVRVGLTVSPHVDSITERIQIDNQQISEEAFCGYLDEFLDLIKPVKYSPSFFELVMIFAMWVFVKEGVEYAVFETGVGGLLDTTNVVRRADKVCVITDIGLDHMAVLGDTIEEIAQQKAGIIHEGNTVLANSQPAVVLSVIKNRCDAVGAKFNLAPKLQGSRLKHVQRNWQLALAAINYVAERDRLSLDLNFGPEDVSVPARMEKVDGVIMDGAHNAQKTRALVDGLSVKYPGELFTVLVAYKNDKQYRDSVDILSTIAKRFIITSFNRIQDVPIKPHDPEIIQKYCKQKEIKSDCVNNPKEAYEKLLAAEGNKLVTGSFYLISELRS